MEVFRYSSENYCMDGSGVPAYIHPGLFSKSSSDNLPEVLLGTLNPEPDVFAGASATTLVWNMFVMLGFIAEIILTPPAPNG